MPKFEPYLQNLESDLKGAFRENMRRLQRALTDADQGPLPPTSRSGPSAMTVGVDNSLLNEHIFAENPHPQYALSSDVVALNWAITSNTFIRPDSDYSNWSWTAGTIVTTDTTKPSSVRLHITVHTSSGNYLDGTLSIIKILQSGGGDPVWLHNLIADQLIGGDEWRTTSSFRYGAAPINSNTCPLDFCLPYQPWLDGVSITLRGLDAVNCTFTPTTNLDWFYVSPSLGLYYLRVGSASADSGQFFAKDFRVDSGTKTNKVTYLNADNEIKETTVTKIDLESAVANVATKESYRTRADISNSTDWNDLLPPSMYRQTGGIIGVNGPSGAYGYGFVFVEGTTSTRLIQTYYPDRGGGSADGGFWTRVSYAGVWKDWVHYRDDATADATADARYVAIAGSQIITGEKTFSAGWVAPYAWMGTAANGFNFGSVGTTHYGIWRRSVASPNGTNFAFLASDSSTLINAPTTVGMYISDSARVYLAADETTLFAGSGDNLNRVTLRRYPSGTATAMYVGVPWSSQTTSNHRFYFGTASTEINNTTAVCLSVNNVTTLKVSSGETNAYGEIGVNSGSETYSRIRLSTNIDSLNYVGIGFGAGTSARDTYLMRLGVNALYTPGSLNVAGEFTTNASVTAGGSVLCTKQFRIGTKNTVASAATVDVTGKSFIAFTGTTTTTLTGGTAGCLYVLTSGDANSRNINFTCQGGATRTIFVCRCWPLIVIAYGSGVFEPLSA